MAGVTERSRRGGSRPGLGGGSKLGKSISHETGWSRWVIGQWKPFENLKILMLFP